MKIQITVPETGVHELQHRIVRMGEIIDLPFHHAEHFIRLGQAKAVEDLPKAEPKEYTSEVRS